MQIAEQPVVGHQNASPDGWPDVTQGDPQLKSILRRRYPDATNCFCFRHDRRLANDHAILHGFFPSEKSVKSVVRQWRQWVSPKAASNHLLAMLAHWDKLGA